MSSTNNPTLFKQTLQEFIQVILTLAVLGGLAYYLIGAYLPRSEKVTCNAETVKLYFKAPFFYQSGKYITGAKLRSDEFALHGKYSLRLTGKDPYGFGYDIPSLTGNEELTVSVWRYADEKDASFGKLVASGPCGFWKAGEEVVDSLDNGWQKIQFTFMPPKKCKGKKFKIYCWNTASHPIFFDDLEIQMKQVYY